MGVRTKRSVRDTVLVNRAEADRRVQTRLAASWQDPGSDGEKLGVFDFPTFIFGRLVGIIKRSLMPNYVAPFGLSIPEWRVLAAIAVGAPISFNEICGTLVMDRAQVSRTLTGLLSRGLIDQSVMRRNRRGRGHAVHQTKHVATAKGRSVYAGVLRMAQQQQMILLRALNREERAALQHATLKVLAAAEQFEAMRALTSERARPQRSRATQRAAAPVQRKQAGKRLVKPSAFAP